MTTSCDPARIHSYSGGDARVRSRDEGARCVVLWMARTQRSRDNLAFDVAVELANEQGLPLVVLFRLSKGPPDNDMRHAAHMVSAFPELAEGVVARNATFALLGPGGAGRMLELLDALAPSVVVCDDDAMPHAVRGRERVAAELAVPLLAVDADVIVPTRVFTRPDGKPQHAAYTLRPKMHKVLSQFEHELGRNERAAAKPLGEAPEGFSVVLQWFAPGAPGALDVARLERELLEAGVPDVAGRVERGSGMAAAQAQLDLFVSERLDGYSTRRNQPDIDGTSELSPFLHYGHVSPHAVVAAVRAAGAPRDDEDAFIEEFIVRRELAVNFVRFAGEASRSLAGAPNWARITHEIHASDERPVILSADQMAACESPDPLWNAAQRQLLQTGTMHGYLRMYWAKQILTWTPSAEAAFATALHLHDRYAIDARDPNSITGVAWSIGGVHDRAWNERAIFGKVRSMTLASTGRKFNSKAYMRRWSGLSGASERGQLTL